MGGQKGIYLFLTYLARYHPVICYTTSNNVPGGHENFTVKKIIGNGRLRYINPFYFFRLRREFRRDGITHLLLEQPYYGWLAFLLKKFLKIKLIVHSHNIEALRFKSTKKWWWRIMARYEKWIHKKADFSFFISQEDKAYAIKQYKLSQEKCAVITYGTECQAPPSAEQKAAAKEKLCQKHNIAAGNLLLLFNGTLNYPPNQQGLDSILHKINPLLLKQAPFPYKILICGSRLPISYHNLEAYIDDNIIYPGFVDDIDLYFTASDIFINPVCEGGGIKTKLVEALASGCAAVSYEEGAIGVPADVTGKKLSVVENNNPSAFADAVLHTAGNISGPTPYSFYAHFYWGNIARKAAEKISAV